MEPVEEEKRNVEVSAVTWVLETCDIGALISRIGFGRILYYGYNKELPR